MKRIGQISIFIVSFLLYSVEGIAQDTPIRLDFSGQSASENGITVMGAGFGTYPMADVSFGNIPTDNAFEGATDGRGMIVKADPGEGVMIFGKTINTPNVAMIRCSVRANSLAVSITLASIDQGEYQFISTTTPNNGAFFLNQYKRISGYFIPPSTAFQPLLQIVNTSPMDSLTVYLDNFDIYLLEPGRYYNAEFLDGDQNDPETISILMESTPLPTPTQNILPTATPTPTNTPIITNIPTPTTNTIPPVFEEEMMYFGRGQLTSLAYSPDGKFFLTGISNGNTLLLDIETGQIIRTFFRDLGTVNAVVFSPDGTKIVTGHSGGLAILWDIASGKAVRVFSGHTDSVNSIAYSPDGTRIVTGSTDKTAKMWDVATGKVITTFYGFSRHTDSVYSVAFSPDGTKVLTGSSDGTAKLWDAFTGLEIHTFLMYDEYGGHGFINSVTFSPDGTKILIGNDTSFPRYFGYDVVLWDATTGDKIGAIPTRNSVANVAFSPDGTKILTVDNEGHSGGIAWGNIRLWDVTNGSEVRSFSFHADSIISAVFSPDGSKIITGYLTEDKTWINNKVTLWDVNTSENIHTFDILPADSYGSFFNIFYMAFSPDRTKAVIGGHSGFPSILNITTHEIIPLLGSSYVSSVAFSPDGTKVLAANSIYAGNKDITVNMWDAFTGELIQTFSGFTVGIDTLTFSPDGTKFLAGSGDNSTKILDISSGEVIHTFSGFTGLTFSTDGEKILTVNSDNTLSLIDIATSQVIRTFTERTSSITPVEFSPDGTKILTGGNDNLAYLWDAFTGELIHTFVGHTKSVKSVTFSPDGAKILTGSSDGTVKLWDTASGSEIRTFSFSKHKMVLLSVAFSPDGNKVYIGGVRGRGDSILIYSMIT